MNNVKGSVLDAIVRDNEIYVVEGNLGDHLMSDFASYPPGWDCVFDGVWDTLSEEEREERSRVLWEELNKRGCFNRVKKE